VPRVVYGVPVIRQSLGITSTLALMFASPCTAHDRTNVEPEDVSRTGGWDFAGRLPGAARDFNLPPSGVGVKEKNFAGQEIHRPYLLRHVLIGSERRYRGSRKEGVHIQPCPGSISSSSD
jgi:hypothetical protein